LDRYGHVRFQDAQARTGGQFDPDPIAEARQRHSADARLPAGDVAGRAGDSRPAQGQRLQDRAHETALCDQVAAEIRRGAAKGAEDSDREPTSDLERGAHGRLIVARSLVEGRSQGRPFALAAYRASVRIMIPTTAP